MPTSNHDPATAQPRRNHVPDHAPDHVPDHAATAPQRHDHAPAHAAITPPQRRDHATDHGPDHAAATADNAATTPPPTSPSSLPPGPRPTRARTGRQGSDTTAHRPRRLQHAALDAAAQGHHVFPVRPRTKVPAIPGWEQAATRDPARIQAWWAGQPYNIGLATGPSGLLVIDLDPAHGHTPPPRWAGTRHGLDVLLALAATAGAGSPLATHTVTTPSGGRHLYFRAPTDIELRNSQGTLGWRIDTRGHGGYVLAAGSVLPTGRYATLAPMPVAELPDWIAAALTPPPPAPVAAAAPELDALVPDHRLRAYLRAVIDGETRAVANAPVGQRHQTLLRAARKLGHWVGSGTLPEHHARAALTAAAASYRGVGGYTERQIARDITDGLAYGARRPRYPHTIGDRNHSTPQRKA